MELSIIPIFFFFFKLQLYYNININYNCRECGLEPLSSHRCNSDLSPPAQGALSTSMQMYVKVVEPKSPVLGKAYRLGAYQPYAPSQSGTAFVYGLTVFPDAGFKQRTT